jgi:tetratricopeptide (TPR) repeat protein
MQIDRDQIQRSEVKHRPTIFLSGVSEEFASFRDAIEKRIRKKSCFAENQPNWPNEDGTVESSIRRRLEDCDAVIHIVGFRFGRMPANQPPAMPPRSYTQMEYDIARELGKPIYVYLSKHQSVRDKPLKELQAEDPDVVALQIGYRFGFEHSNQMYSYFRNRQHLCDQVANLSIVALSEFKTDISRVMKHAGAQLIGRQFETDFLNETWLKARLAQRPRQHVVTIVGFAGEGKTSLVANWLASLASENWPSCDAVFAWSFNDQGSQDENVNSSELFLTESLTFFGDREMAQSAKSSVEKGKRLAQLVCEKRAILILDGIEALQVSPASSSAGGMRETGLLVFLTGLASQNRGLCVVTTRYTISSLNAFQGKTVFELTLPRLSNVAGVTLLKTLGVCEAKHSDCGRINKNDHDQLSSLVEEVRGHALTLNLIGTYLRDAHAGDVRKRDLIRFEEADSELRGGHAFRVIDAYIRWFESEDGIDFENTQGKSAVAILRLMGLFDGPASAGCLKSLWEGAPIDGLTETIVELTETQINLVIKRLERAGLLIVSRRKHGQLHSLDVHPLIRQYFARHSFFSKAKHSDQGNSLRLAHLRVCNHLLEANPPQQKPSLDELQPLYQAVRHGCLAGMQNTLAIDAYRNRILQGRRFYSTKQLGAFANDLKALTYFFSDPYRNVASHFPDQDQAWILTESAICLRALGRLNEAVEPLERAIRISHEGERWSEAAMQSCILAQLQLLRGSISEAYELCVVAVRNADLSESIVSPQGIGAYNNYRTTSIELGYESHSGYLRVLTRARLADTLHHLGKFTDAMDCFREAEALQAQVCSLPYLGSIPGSRYCDLLLADIEDACWRVFYGKACPNKSELLQRLVEIEKRTSETLQFASNAMVDVLSQACDQLTLGRCELYREILSVDTEDVLASSQENCKDSALAIAAAMSRIKDAGVQYHITRAALPLAWARTWIGGASQESMAIELLDEAMDICQRGTMPLQTIDILLSRVRLFGTARGSNRSLFSEKDMKQYPWKSVMEDFLTAKELATKHRYGRREREFALLEQVLATSNAHHSRCSIPT